MTTPDSSHPHGHDLAIGIDFGGTSIKTGVVAGRRIIGGVERIPTTEYNSPDSLIDAIVAKVEDLRSRHPSVKGIGIGVPGAVNFEAGVTYNLTNVPGWKNVPLKQILEERTGLPTILDNDANCAVLAEWLHGAARGFRNVVMVTLGTGVGGGLILDGKMYRGSRSAAGEIGQVSIDYDGGVPGPYGNTGALERYIGHQQISDHAARSYKDAGVSGSEAKTDLVELSDAARAGDPVALQVWSDVGIWLGNGLANIIWVLNPDAIVIGGGVAAAGGVLLDPLSRRIQEVLSPEFWQQLRLLRAELGNEAGIIGSAALILDEA